MRTSKFKLLLILFIISNITTMGQLPEKDAKLTIEYWCYQNSFKISQWQGVIIVSDNQRIGKAILDYQQIWMKNPPMEFTFNRTDDGWVLTKIDVESGFEVTQGFSDRIRKPVFLKVGEQYIPSDILMQIKYEDSLTKEQKAAIERAKQDSLVHLQLLSELPGYEGLYRISAGQNLKLFKNKFVAIKTFGVTGDQVLSQFIDDNTYADPTKYILMKYNGDTYSNIESKFAIRFFNHSIILEGGSGGEFESINFEKIGGRPAEKIQSTLNTPQSISNVESKAPVAFAPKRLVSLLNTQDKMDIFQENNKTGSKKIISTYFDPSFDGDTESMVKEKIKKILDKNLHYQLIQFSDYSTLFSDTINSTLKITTLDLSYQQAGQFTQQSTGKTFYMEKCTISFSIEVFDFNGNSIGTRIFSSQSAEACGNRKDAVKQALKDGSFLDNASAGWLNIDVPRFLKPFLGAK